MKQPSRTITNLNYLLNRVDKWCSIRIMNIRFFNLQRICPSKILFLTYQSVTFSAYLKLKNTFGRKVIKNSSVGFYYLSIHLIISFTCYIIESNRFIADFTSTNRKRKKKKNAYIILTPIFIKMGKRIELCSIQHQSTP